MNPKEASSLMNNSWQKITCLPAGGTISGISRHPHTSKPDETDVWICSPAGLFKEENGQLSHHARGIPFSSASAVFSTGKTVLAAGYPNQLIRSADGGRTWFGCWADGLLSPVTCFAASPNYSRDATVLAGSDGDGILRSTDGGNSWNLSNFGLRCFNILDIACAPVHESSTPPNGIPFNYEIVFAATEQGVYQSPNMGRAWRYIGNGLPSVPVLSVAISPDFQQLPALSSSSQAGSSFKGAVFAGTDGAGLYCSRDGGKSWQVITSFPTDCTDWTQVSVNTLFFDLQGRLFMGTSGQGILVSADLGETWQYSLKMDDVILQLAGHGKRLLAGTAEHGLWVSNNAGISWQITEGFSARYVTSLAGIPAYQRPVQIGLSRIESLTSGNLLRYNHILVAGLTEGIWENSKDEWRMVTDLRSTAWPAEQPILDLQATQDRFLALTPDYLLAAQIPVQGWVKLFEAPGSKGRHLQFTTLACNGKEIFLGSLSGEIWASSDAGKTWEKTPADLCEEQILSLLVVRDGTALQRIYAATRKTGEGLMVVWCAETRQVIWKPIFQERTNWLTANLIHLPPAEGSPAGERDILLATGTDIYYPEGSGWRRQTVTKPDAPVGAMLSLQEQNILLLSTPGKLLLSRNRGASWEPAGLQGFNITDLYKLPGDGCKVLALSSDGTIFGYKF